MRLENKQYEPSAQVASCEFPRPPIAGHGNRPRPRPSIPCRFHNFGKVVSQNAPVVLAHMVPGYEVRERSDSVARQPANYHVWMSGRVSRFQVAPSADSPGPSSSGPCAKASRPRWIVAKQLENHFLVKFPHVDNSKRAVFAGGKA